MNNDEIIEDAKRVGKQVTEEAHSKPNSIEEVIDLLEHISNELEELRVKIDFHIGDIQRARVMCMKLLPLDRQIEITLGKRNC